jgi:Zn-dependent protease
MRSLRLGRAFGIPLFIHPTFFLLPLLAMMQSAGGGAWTSIFCAVVILAIFGCVLLHELGHALMARYFGIRTRDITLYPIGGIARLEKMSEKPTEDLLIAVAGPAVNVAIVGLLTPFALFGLVAGAHLAHGEAGPIIDPANGLLPILGAFAVSLWIANIILVVFNLLPVFPMDGGRVLRALLGLWTTHLRATEIASRVGLVMAVLLAAVAVFQHLWVLLIVALFVAFAGHQELMMLRYREAQRQAEQAAGYQQPYTSQAVGYGLYGPYTLTPNNPAPQLGPPQPGEPVWGGPGLDVPPPVLHDPLFTGLVWDRTWRVWVRWVNGQPVEAYWGRVE